MPISIVVGGQFGSEGKGKVALEIARRTRGPATVVRVGGPNSGHTAYDTAGRRWALRQMPAACVDKNVDVVFPAGSYLDVDLLLSEVDALNYPRDRIYVSKYANIITESHKNWERESGLTDAIGSTGAGVGAAVMASVARLAKNFPIKAIHAQDVWSLETFACDTTIILRDKIDRGERLIIEGSQGFGLSLLDGGFWPKATARSTTAAAALMEIGMSPRFVDDITLVLRSFPIRVAGDSGPLVGETTWANIASSLGRPDDIREYTTVTNKLRRVGHFDAALARSAILANAPIRIVLNHLDYIGCEADVGNPSSDVAIFIRAAEQSVGQRFNWLGFDPLGVVENSLSETFR